MISLRLHATCVAISGQGILLTGASGCGKSDLALRLIDAGAELVSDDQVVLSLRDTQLIAAPPPSIAGLIEVRHIGLLRVPYQAEVTLALQVELVPIAETVPRLPEPRVILYLDRPLRCLRLPATAASTPAKIRAALRYPDVTDTP